MDLIDEKMKNAWWPKTMRVAIQNTWISYKISKYFISKMMIVFLEVFYDKKIFKIERNKM